MDQSNQDQKILLPFHSFDVILQEGSARASAAPPVSIINCQHIMFLDVSAMVSIMEWSSVFCPELMMLEPWKEFIDEEGEDTVSLLSRFLSNLPLVALRTKRRKPKRGKPRVYSALVRFQDTTARISVSFGVSEPDFAGAEQLKALIAINVKLPFSDVNST